MIPSLSEAFDLMEAQLASESPVISGDLLQQQVDREYEEFCVDQLWQDYEASHQVACEIEQGFRAIEQGIDGTNMHVALMDNKLMLAQRAVGEYVSYMKSITLKPVPLKPKL